MINIRKIDLNLLAIFHALCIEKNTTKAAHRLGLSQPTISHGLKRLREVFNDPLFVRASRGIVPTKRAISLEKPVSAFLNDIQAFLNQPQVFDPAQAKMTFRIATTDYFEQIVLAKLLKTIAKTAPQITLISLPTLGELPKNEMESGQIDLAIAGFYKRVPEGYYKQNIFKDDFVCVARKNHPELKGPLSLKKYVDMKHLLITLNGDLKAKSVEILTKQGLEQNIVAGAFSFTSPGWILCDTDLLLTAPRKLAHAYRQYFPVQIHELPFNMTGIEVAQVWHVRHHNDSAHRWFRGLIHEICQKL